ncbi:uncharacterized membrane protein YhaH (DUF805 family) [Panacagrimonas perspica]|uniref:Uncharacterized membrane protein YhaH (DUF805 family) n=1 Tax=Panacagrimonas perspica TaxID=381431 RepID=A0A4S3KA89_9GAMM|nr:hypothetical protein [Panacagrimonas perspica]TDU24366.1 uncharacterized membrane protein YhaH (DUF805 family) [Panacagrimonas perspica]THD04754.1 hypothetical protein B1810_04950 [Panacagrimonas perspica]
MNRSRYWVHIAFWLPALVTLALIVLGAQTRGGVMDSEGDVRHFVVMAVCLLALSWIVAARAYDAGMPGWMSVLAVPAAIAFLPFSALGLGLLLTSDRRRASEPVKLWWMIPSAAAGIGLAYGVSLMLR